MPCLTCGEKKIWCTIRKSKNIVTMIVETHVKLCMIEQAGFSRKKFSAPKVTKMDQRQGFLNLLKNLVTNFY